MIMVSLRDEFEIISVRKYHNHYSFFISEATSLFIIH